jgi:hypothetical protein
LVLVVAGGETAACGGALGVQVGVQAGIASSGGEVLVRLTCKEEGEARELWLLKAEVIVVCGVCYRGQKRAS